LANSLTIENTGEQRLAIRELVIRREGGEPIVQPVGVIVPAGARTDVSVSLPNDTPPGDHEVEVELPNERRTMTIRVYERHELRVRPTQIVVPVGTSGVRVSVTNTGNVVTPLAPVTTSEKGEIRLALTKPPKLEPGSAADISGEVTVSDDLDPHRRHELDVPIGTADVTFVVLPRVERRSAHADRN
jgi:hypothetical protein